MTKINIDFKEFLKSIILSDKELKLFYETTHSHTKYTLNDILTGILFILKTGIW